MQLQKTRMAKPQTKTTISQKQSLELVQTMLHSGVSVHIPFHQQMLTVSVAQQPFVP